jgi:hypothetical protein
MTANSTQIAVLGTMQLKYTGLWFMFIFFRGTLRLMFSSFCVVVHGLTFSAADGITAEIMTSNYGGFSKAVTGDKMFG